MLWISEESHMKGLEKQISIQREHLHALLREKEYQLDDIEIQDMAKMMDKLICEYYGSSFKKGKSKGTKYNK